MKLSTFQNKCKQADEKQLTKYFITACEKGDLERVKYLLTSSELKENVNIHTNHDIAIFWACSRGDLELAKYLLTSPELKEHADIHGPDDVSFRFACLKKHINVVSYLIFDYNIKKTPKIEELLSSYPHEPFFEKVKNMFSVRNLNSQLQEDLVSRKPDINNKNIKI